MKNAIWDESMTDEENIAFVEVLIYERCGLFLLRSLQAAYSEDES